MFTKESVSASTNVIMTVSGPAALYMPGSDSNFNNFIKDDLVEFSVSFVIHNFYSTVPEFI